MRGCEPPFAIQSPGRGSSTASSVRTTRTQSSSPRRRWIVLHPPLDAPLGSVGLRVDAHAVAHVDPEKCNRPSR